MSGGIAIGIDLGCRSSRVAVVTEGVATVMPSPEGNRAIPSQIAFDSGGAPLVGEMAERQALTDPLGSALGFTRLLGRRFDDPRVQSEMRSRVHAIERGPAGETRLRVGRQEIAPEAATALMLLGLRAMAEGWAGRRIDDAVFTVPHRFGPAERRGLRTAAWIAGLEVRGFIDPATAAVLPYALGNPEAGVVAVVDLGAGSLDVGLYRVAGGDIQILARDGDTELGGDDLDHALVRGLVDRFAAENDGLDLNRHPVARQRVLVATRAAKHALSGGREAAIFQRNLVGSQNGALHLETSMSRSELELACKPLVRPLLATLKRVLASAGLAAESVQVVLPTGGQTRTDRFRKVVGSIFSEAKVPDLDPEGWSACGAAIEALLVEAAPSPRSSRPTEVLPSSFDQARMAASVRRWWSKAAGRPPGLASTSPMSRELLEDLSLLMRDTPGREASP